MLIGCYYLFRTVFFVDKVSHIVKSKCDGNRNIVHVCVSACKPVVSKTSKGTDTTANGNKEHDRSGMVHSHCFCYEY